MPSKHSSAGSTGAPLKDLGNAYLSTPVDGMLLLFPAYLLHAGLPYPGDRDRIVIAFNSPSYLVEAPAPERR